MFDGVQIRKYQQGEEVTFLECRQISVYYKVRAIAVYQSTLLFTRHCAQHKAVQRPLQCLTGSEFGNTCTVKKWHFFGTVDSAALDPFSHDLVFGVLALLPNVDVPSFPLLHNKLCCNLGSNSKLKMLSYQGDKNYSHLLKRMVHIQGFDSCGCLNIN